MSRKAAFLLSAVLVLSGAGRIYVDDIRVVKPTPVEP